MRDEWEVKIEWGSKFMWAGKSLTQKTKAKQNQFIHDLIWSLKDSRQCQDDVMTSGHNVTRNLHKVNIHRVQHEKANWMNEAKFNKIWDASIMKLFQYVHCNFTNVWWWSK